MDYRFYNVLAGYGTRLCETKEELHQHRATEKVCEIKKDEGYRLDYFIFFRFISRFFYNSDYQAESLGHSHNISQHLQILKVW